MILVNELGKVYGDLVAVDNLDFEIPAGQTLGLLGPNGAGKSTTINMIVGLLRPDRGEVQIGAADDIAAGSPFDPQVRRRIGISPQSISLYEELTARENLNFFGSLYGLAGKTLRRRVDWALAFAGLDDRQHDRVASFSGGMKRRLNMAAALVHEPDILLLDEPTVGVDPQSRNHIFEAVESLQRSGLTVIYTTHYMEEAQRLCDRVAIVDRGSLLALDTVDSLLDQYGGHSSVTADVAEVADEYERVFANELVNDFSREGNQIRFMSERPLEAIARLAGQVEFQTLNIARPNLESVFLSLTGRGLRD